MLVLKVFTTMLPFSVPCPTSWSNLAFLETRGSPPCGKVTNPKMKIISYFAASRTTQLMDADLRSTDANIPDDKVVESNKPGYITFATAGPNTRTTQVLSSLFLYLRSRMLSCLSLSPLRLTRLVCRCSSTTTTTRFSTTRDSLPSAK